MLNSVFVHSTFVKCVLWGAGTAQSGCRLSCGLGSLESHSWQGQEIFFFLQNIQTGSDAHPVSYSMGTGGSYPESKEPGCEVDHSPLFSAAVKNEWLSMSAPPVCLHDVHRNCFIFIFHHSYDILLNPLKPELNSICYLLALLGAHHFLHVNRIRVKLLTLR